MMQLLMFTHPDGGSAQVVVVWPSTGDAKAVKEISTLPSFIMAVSLQEFLLCRRQASSLYPRA
jgi:hypothetical protein